MKVKLFYSTQVFLLFTIFHEQLYEIFLKLILHLMSDRFFEKNFLKMNRLLENSIFKDVLFDRWECFIARKGFSKMDELVFYLRPYPGYLFFDRIGFFLVDNLLDLKINEEVLSSIKKMRKNFNVELREITYYIQYFHYLKK